MSALCTVTLMDTWTNQAPNLLDALPAPEQWLESLRRTACTGQYSALPLVKGWEAHVTWCPNESRADNSIWLT
jgi:hypothetical protein